MPDIATTYKRPRPPGRKALIESLPDLRLAPDELMLSRAEAAAILRATPSRLKQMIESGQGPSCIQYRERQPRYRLADMRAWQQCEATA